MNPGADKFCPLIEYYSFWRGVIRKSRKYFLRKVILTIGEDGKNVVTFIFEDFHWKIVFLLYFLVLLGIGSCPCPPHGWQESILFIPNQVPFHIPHS